VSDRGPLPAERVLDLVRDGAQIVVPLANGEPPALLDVLEAEAGQLQGVRIHQMHAAGDRRYLHGVFGDRLRHVSYFLSAASRPAFWEGEVDLVPAHFSAMPSMLRRFARASLVCARSSLPDERGFFSLGTNADYTASLIGSVPFFLEACPSMPWTFGDHVLHESQVAGWCVNDAPLLVEARPVPSQADRQIGALVAERVPDRATVQIGIGRTAEAVTAALGDHRELGIHTELLSDGLADLIEAGVATGTHKELRRCKAVATFCLGTARLYRWLDRNPAVEMAPVDWVNDPAVVAREPRFVSINGTTEVDLFGQCASETIAGRYWSSSGGQADFARGALEAEGGLAFMVLRSRASDGRARIKTRLSDGSVVTTSKNAVDHVVTEWGVAELRGRSLAERARRLIAIAHPDDREDLEREARNAGLLGRFGRDPS
jgi:acyl-CoA hydrolase